MKPVWDIVQQTIERTAAAWKTLPARDVLPADMEREIGAQIEKASQRL